MRFPGARQYKQAKESEQGLHVRLGLLHSELVEAKAEVQLLRVRLEEAHGQTARFREVSSSIFHSHSLSLFLSLGGRDQRVSRTAGEIL